MRVLVCGSRDWTHEGPIAAVVAGMWAAYGPDMTVIEGGAPGADSMAGHYANTLAPAVSHERYPADWDTHYKAAGRIRNQQMLDEGKPDVVWAFVSKPLAQSRGTADMVRRARAAGIPVYVVERAS